MNESAEARIEEFKNFPFDEFMALKGNKRRQMTEGIKKIARNPLNSPEIRYKAYEALLEVKQNMYDFVDKERNEFDSVCCQIRNLVKDRMNISDDVIDLNLKIRELNAEIDKKNRVITSIVKRNRKSSVDELLEEVGGLIDG